VSSYKNKNKSKKIQNTNIKNLAYSQNVMAQSKHSHSKGRNRGKERRKETKATQQGKL
jgi:hypothetical protein